MYLQKVNLQLYWQVFSHENSNVQVFILNWMLIHPGKQKTSIIFLAKCNQALGTDCCVLAESDLCSALELAHFSLGKKKVLDLAQHIV